MQAQLKELARLTGPENLFCDEASRIAHARACGSSPMPILPLAIARPRHLGQVREIFHFCASAAMPIVIRGGATTAFAAPMAANSLVLLTTGLSRILHMDAENRLAALQPGVTCARLAEAAAQCGLFYPPMPWSAGIATIGGNLAMNTAGSSSAKFGPAANFTSSIDIITTNGQELTCPAANAAQGPPDAGLPLANLICGSQGTLAFIGIVRIKLMPQPQKWAKCLFCMREGAGDAAARIAAAGIIPAALDIFDPYCARLLTGNADGWLLHAEFCGSQDEVNEGMAMARDVCAGYGAPQAIPDDFYARRAALPQSMANCGMPFMETFSFPPAHLPNFLAVAARLAACGSRMAIFGHAAAAAMHVFFAEKNDDARHALFGQQLMLNNALADEADLAQTRAQWQAGRAALGALSAKLRPLFDPAGLLAAQPLPGAYSA